MSPGFARDLLRGFKHNFTDVFLSEQVSSKIPVCVRGEGGEIQNLGERGGGDIRMWTPQCVCVCVCVYVCVRVSDPQSGRSWGGGPLGSQLAL